MRQPEADPHRDVADANDRSHPNPYCAVTVVCGHRRLDLALPTAVCCADLLPVLLRLLLTDEAPAVSQPWVLTQIGRDPLTGSETLAEAGVLAGDLLVLEQRTVYQQADSAVMMTRDRIEDVVNGQERFWVQRTSRSVARWAALSTGALLLLPAATLPVGPGSAAMAATVALVVAMTAVLSDRRSENVCAAVGLSLGCVWAAVAGAVAFQGWAAVQGRSATDSVTDAAIGATTQTTLLTLLAATGSALLLAGCAAASYPAALIHTAALLVVGIAGAGLFIAVNAGASLIDAADGAALLAVLLLGGLPRLALAAGGLTGSDPRRESADLDPRITRADRILIGCLTGVSIVAAAAVIPGALSSTGGHWGLAVGIGLLLLLRSRAYSQTRHVLPPRVGGFLVLGIVWLGVYRNDTVPHPVLIVGAAAAVAAWAVVLDVLRPPSPVGLARRGRLLDLAEQLLVVAQIVLTAWVIVLADWVTSVIG